MNFKMTLAMLACSALTCGCASAPEEIAPTNVSTLNYSNMTCQQLHDEDARVSAAYDVAAEQQRKAQKNDAAGVFLLGLPLASMSGKDVATKIADLKGQLNAIHQVEAQKFCNSAPSSTTPVTAGRI